jgi:hypothetical protein
MDIKGINFRVAGMVQRGGFVWSGCPDAVRAAIIALRGIVAIDYDAQEDLFTVRFDCQQARLEDIFAAVYLAGRQSGQDYLPQVVSWRPTLRKAQLKEIPASFICYPPAVIHKVFPGPRLDLILRQVKGQQR